MRKLSSSCYDLDSEMKQFLKILSLFKGRYSMGYEIFKDDGSMNSSGQYVCFDTDSFYFSAIDLMRAWVLINKIRGKTE